MESYLIYFAKVNGLLILFYFMYVLFLRKETFFTSNRWYLLTGLFVSVTLPLLTFTKTIWIETTPIPEFQTRNIMVDNLENMQAIQEPQFDWSVILLTIYGTISLLILLKIGIELASFFKKISNQNIQKLNNYSLVHSNSTENPFSFFNYIVINKNRFSENELQHILTHESIHVAQKHSLDVLLSKLFCALLWVNPIIWLYRKAILQNLEYIADKLSFEQIENKYDYQRTLLKVVTHQHNLSITNQFYQSLIKKRIVMLHTNQSHKRNVLKYAFILPVLVGFMLLFQVETVAQVKEKELLAARAVEIIEVIIDKNSSNDYIQNEVNSLKNEYDIILNVNNIKRNKNNEITAIKINFKDKMGNEGAMDYKDNSGNPINPIRFYKELDENSKGQIGFGGESIKEKFKFLSTNSPNQIEIKDAAVAVVEVSNLEIKETNSSESDQPTNNQLYIINGEEYLYNELSRTNIQYAEKIKVLNKEEGIKKYGEKGKNGVIIITGNCSFEIDGKTVSFEEPKGTTTNELEVSKKEKELKAQQNSKLSKEYIASKTERRTNMELSKKEREIKAQQNSKLNNEKIEDRIEKRKKINENNVKFTTIIETENGNQTVVYDNNRLKIPGSPSVKIDQNGPSIYVNGKMLSNPEQFLKMDPKQIYYVEVTDQSQAENGVITIKRIDVKTK
ncbi:M56 family metallopeptidase [Flavobacterium psychraquaticum]|uniref:M56 family metallopeptidase n=1 Tax=Flavobacterium psychraquaticum TaxID=3103958 RepID=UPI002ACD8FB5|nr:M56 family metallopeptidase [Flavobacterium sp. LB-N7T]